MFTGGSSLRRGPAADALQLISCMQSCKAEPEVVARRPQQVCIVAATRRSLSMQDEMLKLPCSLVCVSNRSTGARNFDLCEVSRVRVSGTDDPTTRLVWWLFVLPASKQNLAMAAVIAVLFSILVLFLSGALVARVVVGYSQRHTEHQAPARRGGRCYAAAKRYHRWALAGRAAVERGAPATCVSAFLLVCR